MTYTDYARTLAAMVERDVAKVDFQTYWDNAHYRVMDVTIERNLDDPHEVDACVSLVNDNDPSDAGFAMTCAVADDCGGYDYDRTDPRTWCFFWDFSRWMFDLTSYGDVWTKFYQKFLTTDSGDGTCPFMDLSDMCDEAAYKEAIRMMDNGELREWC